MPRRRPRSWRPSASPARRTATCSPANSGARQPDFATLTNAGYLGLYNQTAAQIREERGLPRGANLRDHIGLVQLAETAYHEVLTRDELRRQNVHGASDMAAVSHATGERLAEVAGDLRSLRQRGLEHVVLSEPEPPAWSDGPPLSA